MHGDRHYDWPDQEPPDKDKRKRREYPGHGQACLEQIDGKEGPAPAQDHGVNAVMQVEEVDRPVAEKSHTAASIQSACLRRSSNGLRAGTVIALITGSSFRPSPEVGEKSLTASIAPCGREGEAEDVTKWQAEKTETQFWSELEDQFRVSLNIQLRSSQTAQSPLADAIAASNHGLLGLANALQPSRDTAGSRSISPFEGRGMTPKQAEFVREQGNPNPIIAGLIPTVAEYMPTLLGNLEP